MSQMSVNESRARLESIKRVALDISPHERLKAAAVGYFDTARKEVREILCNPNVFEEADRRLRAQLDKISISLVRLPSPRAMEPNNAG